MTVDVGEGDAVFVGRYHCLERLGFGPVGERWRARLYGLGGFEKDVSIVRVHTGLSDDHALRPRLIRAVSLAAQVPIDGLVRVHDVGVDGDRLHLVADAIRGPSLDELRERLYASVRRIPVELVLRILRDVAWTMALAHARVEAGPVGLCHLAITEAAIVIDPDGRARILDVGLIPSLVRPGWLAAPPVGLDLRALAPEVAGGAWFDARSDVFSLGRLGQRLCAPVRPSAMAAATVEDEEDTVVGGCAPEPPSRTGLADEPGIATVVRVDAVAALGRIVDRACSDDPAARHSSMMALVAELDTLDLLGESTARLAIGALVAAVREDERAAAPTGVVPSPRAQAPYEEPLDSEITNRVPLPEQQALMASLSQRLPSPPTLPLTALRGPVRARLAGLMRVGAFVAGGLAIGGAIVGGVLLGRGGARRSGEERIDRGALPERARTVAARASAMPAGGTIRVQISTEPEGALVVIDGVSRGRAPTALELSRGPHRLALLLDGYELVRESMQIDDARTVVRVLRRAELPAALVGPGGLKIRCRRAGGLPLRIFVDDIDTGRDCPNDERLPLQPGSHHVGLYLPDRDELVGVHKPAEVSPSGKTARLYLTY